MGATQDTEIDKKAELDKAIDQMAANWPSPIVARKKFEEFTGGLWKSKTITNYDSLGLGPLRVKLGRSVGYPKDALIEWLKKHMRVVA
jgi:predicted DNA-binding transcriptional regulator AlpA